MNLKIKTFDSTGSTACGSINGLKKQIDFFIESNKGIEFISLSHNVVFGQNLDNESEFTASAIIIYE